MNQICLRIYSLFLTLTTPIGDKRDSGQATSEYALVMLAAALIALLVIAWATGGGGAERPGGVAGRSLRRAGVVDAVVAQVLRHLLAALEHRLDAGVGQVSRDHHGAGQGDPGADGEGGELLTDLVHRPVEVDVHDVVVEVVVLVPLFIVTE